MHMLIPMYIRYENVTDPPPPRWVGAPMKFRLFVGAIEKQENERETQRLTHLFLPACFSRTSKLTDFVKTG